MAVTILIPTYNMGEHLRPLADSIDRAGLMPLVDQLLFVDDGSTDFTPIILQTLAREVRFADKLKVLRLEPNQGRFSARFEGAKLATTEWLLFLDSRVQVTWDFVPQMQRARQREGNTVGWVVTDVRKNIYCLYWRRSHEAIFRRHYSLSQPLELNPANYDQYLKGTGILLCRRADFLSACQAIEHLQVQSDDTLLLREMLEFNPLSLDPSLKVRWEPRSQLGPFLMRIFERGPGFVEYHIFEAPGRYAVVVFFVLFMLALWIGFSFRHPVSGALILAITLPLIALSAWPFGKTWCESLRLMPLHLLVVLFFGFGILRGLGENILKDFGRRSAKNPR